ncbi:MAG: response regulator [Desulfobacteraceae bacterium]|nr:response regulator [Desulfobacteraceae bacterium]MCB9494646.1 response regulator [Desulfobacteraceae bacterium]
MDLAAGESTFDGKGNILLVDDDENITKVISLMIIKLGYTCFSFNDSKKALKSFEENPDKYDLLLTDMTMPGIKGDELAGQIIKIKPDIPVIIFSGYSEKIRTGENTGAYQYLEKPVRKETLGLAIKSCLFKQ